MADQLYHTQGRANAYSVRLDGGGVLVSTQYFLGGGVLGV
jgi:hypothetical protein